MKYQIDQLRLQSAAWGINQDEHQLSLLARYATLLAEYELANVIGTRDAGEIVLNHLIDALSCYLIEDLRRAHSVVDVGTGAGLPGIPLAIVRSELKVTLLDAAEKKVRFLDHARETLGLENLRVLHSRVEDTARKVEFKETFDFATARALAALPVVVEYCAPLVRAGGTVIAMKARLSKEELSSGVTASRELAVRLREVTEVPYDTHLQQKERKLVVFDKIGATPKRFPRKVGQATKRPLGT